MARAPPRFKKKNQQYFRKESASMPYKREFIIKNYIDGREYLLNLHPVIGLSVVKGQGPQKEEYLKNMITEFRNKLTRLSTVSRDELIRSRLIELMEKGSENKPVKILVDNKQWLSFKPINTLKSYFIISNNADTLVVHEKLYGIIEIDLAQLTQNVSNILGDISNEEIWEEVLKRVYNIFQTCFFEAQEYFPGNVEENNRQIRVPVWCEVICGDHLEHQFVNVNQEIKSKQKNIQILMKVKLRALEEKTYVLAEEEIELEEKRKLAEAGIEVLDCMEDFVQIVEKIIFSMSLTTS